MNAYLINTHDLKELGLIHGNVEDSMLKVIIQRVQLSVIEPAVTEKLFNRLLEGVDNTDLTLDEEFLMDKYVIPLLVIACDRKAIPVTTYELRNKGAGTTRDEYFNPATRDEALALGDDVNIDLQIAKRNLVKYLRQNRSKFPLYNGCSCGISYDSGFENCRCGWHRDPRGGLNTINEPTISFR